MLVQFVLGTIIILITIMLVGLSIWVTEALFSAARPWLMRPPHRAKMIGVIMFLGVWFLTMIVIDSWLWASAFLALGIFDRLEPAIYFSMVSFTTLGYGDIVLEPPWRILGAISAVCGLLNVGLMTAYLMDTLRQLRMKHIGDGRDASGS